MNPVEARLVRHAGGFAWSSHRADVAEKKRPGWLSAGVVPSSMRGDTACGRAAFHRFVHVRRQARDGLEVGAGRFSPILGDDGFIESWRRRLQKEVDRPEVPEHRRLVRTTTLLAIHADAAAMKIASMEETAAGCREALAVSRLMKLLACRTLTPASAGEIGSFFGIAPSAVSGTCRRANALIEKRANVGKVWQTIAASDEESTSR